MFLKFGGVLDINKIPNTKDPDHIDVELIITLFTQDSFLYKRLNENNRLKETQCINNMGPYAVLLTDVIENI